MAGENRAELEKVLHHYEGRENRQKYHAAQYLIKHMPGHVSLAGDWMCSRDSLLSVFRSGPIDKEKIETVNAIISRHTPELSLDIQTLTADYLIWNIDRSFEMWEHSPYLQHLDFESFCETVLPYKCFEGQPADYWKQYASTFGDEILGKVSQIDEWRHGVRAAVESVNDAFQLDMTLPLLKPEGMRETNILDLEGLRGQPFHTCLEMSRMGVILGRAHGLPVDLEFLPNWPLQEQSHYWNVAHAENGRDFDYIPFELKPQSPHYVDKRRAKAYRKTYAPDPLLWKLKRNNIDVPAPFGDPFIKDVSDHYNLVSDICIPVSDRKADYACLAVFDNEEWVPVQIGKVRHKKACFSKAGREVLYLVLSLPKNGRQEAISEPFVLDIKGAIHSIIPYHDSGMQDVTLIRKYPAFVHVWPFRDSLTHFVLEASGRPDFSSYVEAARWEDLSLFSADRCFHLDSAFRYWRLRGLRDGPTTLAELYLYSNEGRIEPKSIKGSRVERLFDKNELTSMRIHSDSSAEMDFGIPVCLNRAAVLRRGDGNGIKPGDVYQLYYWDNGGWLLHDEQVADDIRITFKDVPADRLYRIRDITKGRQHRTFLYNEGLAIWY